MKKFIAYLLISVLSSFLSVNAQNIREQNAANTINDNLGIKKENRKLNLNKFETLPILNKGRYKPLDTIARNTLLSIYGKSSFKRDNKKKIPAIEWFTTLLFSPQATENDKLFLVNDPDVVNALGIKTTAARGYYSFKELSLHFDTFNKIVEKAYQIKQTKRNRFETHLLNLYQKVILYTNIRKDVIKVTDDKSRRLWVSMAAAYFSKDQKLFDDSINAYIENVKDKLPPKGMEKIKAEVTFNKVDPFYRSGLILGFALIVCLIGFYYQQKRAVLTALALCSIAFLLQTYGIYSRMVIMGRPPVTNLYSTFISTAWICNLIGIGIFFVLPEKFKRISPLAASVSALAFLIISGKYDNGDNMGVMVAVLNSNFWLATHVTTIIFGYAGCCFSGLFAHFYLISRITNKKDPELTQVLYKLMIVILGFGFSMTFIGTVLGGVWADQSWGRFWGWDPKENGALLIVLWCAVIFHCKVGALVKKLWIAIGSILGIQVVMLAWFGINKLGVGLHSYGSDPNSNAIRNLIVFAIIELAFLVTVLFFERREKIDS